MIVKLLKVDKNFGLSASTPNNINTLSVTFFFFKKKIDQFHHYPAIAWKSLYRKRTGLNLVKTLVTGIFKIMNNMVWLCFFSCSSLYDFRFVVGQDKTFYTHYYLVREKDFNMTHASQWHYLYPVVPNFYILSWKLCASKK